MKKSHTRPAKIKQANSQCKKQTTKSSIHITKHKHRHKLAKSHSMQTTTIKVCRKTKQDTQVHAKSAHKQFTAKQTRASKTETTRATTTVTLQYPITTAPRQMPNSSTSIKIKFLTDGFADNKHTGRKACWQSQATNHR